MKFMINVKEVREQTIVVEALTAQGALEEAYLAHLYGKIMQEPGVDCKSICNADLVNAKAFGFGKEYPEIKNGVIPEGYDKASLSLYKHFDACPRERVDMAQRALAKLTLEEQTLLGLI